MLPALNINDWRDSRDSIHQYARIMGKIRSTFMPRTRHWWHITLYVNNPDGIVETGSARADLISPFFTVVERVGCIRSVAIRVFSASREMIRPDKDRPSFNCKVIIWY